jgi:hypothetical protein
MDTAGCYPTVRRRVTEMPAGTVVRGGGRLRPGRALTDRVCH